MRGSRRGGAGGPDPLWKITKTQVAIGFLRNTSTYGPPPTPTPIEKLLEGGPRGVLCEIRWWTKQRTPCWNHIRYTSFWCIISLNHSSWQILNQYQNECLCIESKHQIWARICQLMKMVCPWGFALKTENLHKEYGLSVNVADGTTFINSTQTNEPWHVISNNVVFWQV